MFNQSDFLYCCDSTSTIVYALKLKVTLTMTDPTEKTTETLLQDLLQKVSLLQQGVSNLKKNDNTKQQQSRKRPCDGDGLESQLIRCDGDDNNDHNLDEESDSNPEPEIRIQACLPTLAQQEISHFLKRGKPSLRPSSPKEWSMQLGRQRWPNTANQTLDGPNIHN